MPKIEQGFSNNNEGVRVMQAEEASMIERMKAWAQKLAKVFALSTAVMLSGCTSEKVQAEARATRPTTGTRIEQVKVEKAERIDIREQMAIDTLRKLFTEQADPDITNPVLQGLNLEAIARCDIWAYAKQINSVKGSLTPKNINDAVIELRYYTDAYVGQNYGNKDGKFDQNKNEEFYNDTRDNPGLKVLTGMIHQANLNNNTK